MEKSSTSPTTLTALIKAVDPVAKDLWVTDGCSIFYFFGFIDALKVLRLKPFFPQVWRQSSDASSYVQIVYISGR